MSKTAEQIQNTLFGHARFGGWGGRGEEFLIGITIEYFVSRIDQEDVLMQ